MLAFTFGREDLIPVMDLRLFFDRMEGVQESPKTTLSFPIFCFKSVVQEDVACDKRVSGLCVRKF